jgi:hypothetical protein
MRLPCLLVAALMCAVVPTNVARGQDKGHAAKTAKTTKPETSHLVFVKEYIRELTEDEDLKTSLQKELASAKTPDEKISSGIYVSKSVQLELRSQIAMLAEHATEPALRELDSKPGWFLSARG